MLGPWWLMSSKQQPQILSRASVQADEARKHLAYTQVLRAWAHLGQPERVAEVLDAMSRLQLVVGARLHNAVLRALGRAGQSQVCACICISQPDAALHTLGCALCRHRECLVVLPARGGAGLDRARPVLMLHSQAW